MTASGMGFWPMARAQNRPTTRPGQPLEDRYYVFCLFNGGWDILLSLDPRDPAVFTPQAARATGILPGYDMLRTEPNGNGVYLPNRLALAGSDQRAAVGGYLGDLLSPQNIDDICIVRGVNMNTLAHDVGRVRARTGRPPAGNLPRGSSAATWLAHHYGQGELAPNLALKEEVYNAELSRVVDPTSVGSVPDLTQLLAPTEMQREIDPSVFVALDGLLDGVFPCAEDGLSPTMEAAALGRRVSEQMLARNLVENFDFLADNEHMQRIRNHYGFDANSGGLESPGARAALASQAITTGFARVVSLTLGEGFDTHMDNWWKVHGALQMSCWNAIARLMEDLRSTPIGDGSGDTYLDRTTIVAYSDFSRSPGINQFTGRDHWLTSCYLLAGADIQGGQVVGSSSDSNMTPNYTNLTTGALDAANGVIIEPAHVLQTLFYAAGFDMNEDPADMRVPPLTAILRNG